MNYRDSTYGSLYVQKNVRGPVATILGLVKLFNFEDMTAPTNKVVIEGIASIADQLDIAVKEVIKKENSPNA